MTASQPQQPIATSFTQSAMLPSLTDQPWRAPATQLTVSIGTLEANQSPSVSTSINTPLSHQLQLPPPSTTVGASSSSATVGGATVAGTGEAEDNRHTCDAALLCQGLPQLTHATLLSIMEDKAGLLAHNSGVSTPSTSTPQAIEIPIAAAGPAATHM